MPKPEEFDRDSWVETEHERVFYESENDQFDRGEFQLSKFVADHLPGWEVLITMGPYRAHDIHYEVLPDERIIHIDYYSPGMLLYGEDFPHREEHPAVEHAESLLHDVARGIKESDGDFDLRKELSGGDK